MNTKIAFDHGKRLVTIEDRERLVALSDADAVAFLALWDEEGRIAEQLREASGRRYRFARQLLGYPVKGD